VHHASSEENCNDTCHVAIPFKAKRLSVTAGRPASTVRNSCTNTTFNGKKVYSNQNGVITQITRKGTFQ